MRQCVTSASHSAWLAGVHGTYPPSHAPRIVKQPGGGICCPFGALNVSCADAELADTATSSPTATIHRTAQKVPFISTLLLFSMCTNGAADISLKADVKGPFLQVFESFQFRPEFYFAVELQSRNASPQGARRLTLVFIAFLILFALSVIFSESAKTWILRSPLKYRSPDQPVILIFLFGNQQS
jgi:hypothetical protein